MTKTLPSVLALLWLCAAGPASAAALCEGFGPQAPRDIGFGAGLNMRRFASAPPAGEMNLCNMHLHAQAEHRGPGFTIEAGADAGFRCNETFDLTEAELAAPAQDHGGFHGVAPGDTIEVHWVFTTCAAGPGEGLGACMTPSCSNPQLRVESQVFLLVNDPAALDFRDYAGDSTRRYGLYQPPALPEGTGTPVSYAGSTTGPSYSQSACSPLQVTWNVRPFCAKLDISSLHAWAAEGSAFAEDHAHGVRPLVTAPELLAPVD